MLKNFFFANRTMLSRNSNRTSTLPDLRACVCTTRARSDGTFVAMNSVSMSFSFMVLLSWSRHTWQNSVNWFHGTLKGSVPPSADAFLR